MGRQGRRSKLLQPPLSRFVFLLKGKAVFLARDKHHLSDVCHLVRHDVPYLFQKYVKESHGKDIRVVVVGGQVIGSMLRCSTDGRMQSNCSLGEAAGSAGAPGQGGPRASSLGRPHPFRQCVSIPPAWSGPLRGARVTGRS